MAEPFPSLLPPFTIVVQCLQTFCSRPDDGAEPRGMRPSRRIMWQEGRKASMGVIYRPALLLSPLFMAPLRGRHNKEGHLLGERATKKAAAPLSAAAFSALPPPLSVRLPLSFLLLMPALISSADAHLRNGSSSGDVPLTHLLLPALFWLWGSSLLVTARLRDRSFPAQLSGFGTSRRCR